MCSSRFRPRPDLTIDDGEDDAHHHLSSADEVDYSIDSDPVTLLANAHKCREMSANRVLMHRDPVDRCVTRRAEDLGSTIRRR